MENEEFSFETRLLHNRHKIDEATGAVSVPIQHATTFHQSDIDQFGKFDYSRSLNPTREALEEIIAELKAAQEVLPFHQEWLPFQRHFCCFPQETMWLLQRMFTAEHSVW